MQLQFFIPKRVHSLYQNLNDQNLNKLISAKSVFIKSPSILITLSASLASFLTSLTVFTFILFFGLNGFSSNAQANSTIEEFTQYLPAGANLTLQVQAVGSDTPIYVYNNEQQSLPASTLKVITALAALLELGDQFTFITQFETNATIDQSGVLQGDLVLRFSGDPTLTRQDIRNLTAELKKQGVHKINGDLIIDVSAFSGHDKAPGWPWNDLTQCFNAPPSAAIIDRNCFSLTLSAKMPNENAQVNIANFYPVNVLSDVLVLPKGSSDAQYCDLDVMPGELNRYVLTGCMTQRSEPLPLAFSVQDGASYSGALVKQTLLAAEIEFEGKLRRQTLIRPNQTILAQHQSAPLRTLLTQMLKKSDNLIADTVFRTIGQHHFNTSGTWRNSELALRQILKSKAGIDLGNNTIVDGSGLSRHNLVTPKTMMQVLQVIGTNDKTLNFISMLPEAGKDGTLAYRGGLDAAGVNGKVHAKTGALKGVYNLAGFITTASGKNVAFVQFVTGYSTPPGEEKNRRAPLVRFESRLYKYIYQNN